MIWPSCVLPTTAALDALVRLAEVGDEARWSLAISGAATGDASTRHVRSPRRPGPLPTDRILAGTSVLNRLGVKMEYAGPGLSFELQSNQSRGGVAMKRRRLMTAGLSARLSATALALGLATLGLVGPASAADKPNILVVWGDDIGQSNISTYTHGLVGYQTPNIDRIANEGMTFTDYYAEQSCTAGRASFIMGQSVFRSGLSKVGLPGCQGGDERQGPDHRRDAQEHGLRHRPVRQEPPGGSRRAPAHQSRLRRVLWQPLPPQRRGGAGEHGLPRRHGPARRPDFPQEVRPPRRAPLLGHARRHPEDRRHWAADQEAHGDRR